MKNKRIYIILCGLLSLMSFHAFSKESETKIRKGLENEIKRELQTSDSLKKRRELYVCLSKINEVSSLGKGFDDLFKAAHDFQCGSFGRDGTFYYYNKIVDEKKSHPSKTIEKDITELNEELIEAINDLEKDLENELRKVANTCELPIAMRAVACKKVVEIMEGKKEDQLAADPFNGAREPVDRAPIETAEVTKNDGDKAVTQ